VPQNRWEEDSAGRASRSSDLLRLKASRARVPQSGLKTSGGVTRMVYMASSWRSRTSEVEYGWVDATGCIGLFYPLLCHFCCIRP
jgi:hypothetical protein